MIKKVALVIILLIVVFFGWRVAVYFMNIAKTAVNEELRLAEYSGTNYSFYYPKGWIQRQEEGSVTGYFAKNDKGEETGEGITLEISKGQSQMKTPNEELCQLLAQGMATINPQIQGRTQSVVVVNTTNYEGCKIINLFTVNGLPTTSEVKAIWYKDRRDNTMYLSQANYFNDTAEELKATIKDSVNQFSIR